MWSEVKLVVTTQSEVTTSLTNEPRGSAQLTGMGIYSKMRTQQERTIIHMNMHLCNNEDCYMDMWPIIKPSYAEPNELVTFKVYNSHQNSDKYVHFFMDDYQFERIWNMPEKYLPIIKRYKGAISPNFSTYSDMPIPMQIWNVYRSRMIARYWQQNGIDVIPCIQYSNEKSLSWCFDGLPHNSTICLSTVGLMKRTENREGFKAAAEECCKAVSPRTIIIYGGNIPFDCGGAKVIYCKNDNAERVRNNVKNR